MMGLLAREKGSDALVKLVELMAEGLSDREAIAKVWGAPFDNFMGSWQEWVNTLPQTNEDIEIVGLALKDGHGEDEEARGSTVKDPQARDYLRLGDMLRARSRLGAAGVEYEKAFTLTPRSPVVASRHALIQLGQKNFSKALLAMEGVLDLYDSMAVLWARKGEALMGLTRYLEAREAFKRLMDINPFHVPGRMGLLEIAIQLDDKKEIEKERKALFLIMGEEAVINSHPQTIQKRELENE
jgi:tetratricopeptide (TPR) repeat protein